MERSQRMLFLLVVCLITILVEYGLRVHYRHKSKAPSELKTGATPCCIKAPQLFACLWQIGEDSRS
jgi:hypothetical protein